MRFALTPILVLSLLEAARGDGYGLGIAKSTMSASDPIAFFAFLSRYFPVHCQDLHTPCNTSFTCGSSGRASLCLDEACSYPRGPGGAFGIHLVNMSGRPFGALDNIDVEQHFSEKLLAAFWRQTYDSFMDFATVLYAPVLDKYVAALQEDRVPFMVLRWSDDHEQVWYSLLLQVATSQLVLELVSPREPLGVGRIIEDRLSRLPASVFSANSVSSVSPSILIPLAVSKGTSDMRAVESFYKEEMMASETLNSSDGTAHLKTFLLTEANAVIRFVQRPPSVAHGSFGVADLERAKHSGHAMAHTDEFCGVDKWYDNHFAYDVHNTTLDAFKSRFDAHGRIYHIFGDCKTQKVGPGTNIYVVDPTGDAVQLDGPWEHCPTGGSGDALQNPCSQGQCSKYVAYPPCAAQLRDLCSSVQLRNASCTDCCYGSNWGTLSKAGCRNADVVNFCVPSSSSSFFDSDLMV